MSRYWRLFPLAGTSSTNGSASGRSPCLVRVSRGEADEWNDVDVLVEFDRPITLFDLASLEEFLSDVLETSRVDVVLRHSILPALRETILREAIDVR